MKTENLMANTKSKAQRKAELAARHGWAANATTEEKAMAYDLLVAGEQVKPGKASQALWIAHSTLRPTKPPIGRDSRSSPATGGN